MGQISLTLGLVLIALFAFAVIGLAVSFATNNDAPVSILNDSELIGLYSSSEETLGQFREESEETYESIVTSTVEAGSQMTQSAGPYKITVANLLEGGYNTLRVAYSKIFGTGSGLGVFLTAILAVIGLLFALYLVKTWRGNPD